MLFGTTKNAVFIQLFSALITYVLLKFLHTEGQKKNNDKCLSFVRFTRQFLCAPLSIEWRIGLKGILEFHRKLYQVNTELIWLINTFVTIFKYYQWNLRISFLK